MKIDSSAGYDWFALDIKTKLDPVLAIDLRDRFSLKAFVETGTCAGATTEMAALIFPVVLTCELFPAKFPQATSRLCRYQNIHRTFLASEDFLRSIRPGQMEPALIWLDAHWTGDGPRPDKDSPVLEELKIIGGPGTGHCIIIDDARLLGTEGWPTDNAVFDLVQSQGFCASRKGDCLVCTPSSWESSIS